MKQKVTKVSFINLGPEWKALEPTQDENVISIENLNSSDNLRTYIQISKCNTFLKLGNDIKRNKVTVQPRI
jgi:hypothetical protein